MNIVQAWVNVRGVMRVFAVHFHRSEGWKPRNEALMEAVASEAGTLGWSLAMPT